MEIGTIENLDDGDNEESKPVPRSRQGGSGADPGNSDDGGGFESGNPGKKRKFEDPEPDQLLQKSRILMWFLLLAVVMTFGGLIAAYIVLAKNAALEWRPFDLPFQVWISTAIILGSSWTYNSAKVALKKENFKLARRAFIITAALGGMFISSQIMTWLALVNRGLYMTGNPYAGFFYILTAIHAVHVIGGLCALGYILLKTWESPSSDRDQLKRTTDASVIGWYWHTMDGLWLVLLFLLGFWK